jgi:hypothetical protein
VGIYNLQDHVLNINLHDVTFHIHALFSRGGAADNTFGLQYFQAKEVQLP